MLVSSDCEPVDCGYALRGVVLPLHGVFPVNLGVPQRGARRVHPRPGLLHEVDGADKLERFVQGRQPLEATLLRSAKESGKIGSERAVGGTRGVELARAIWGLGLTTTLDVHWFTFVCMKALSPTTFLISCSIRRR